MKYKYFYKDASGLKSDIDRHREEELKLDSKISELEAIKEPTEFEVAALNVYRHFRNQLLQSKADVVSKIGKKIRRSV